MRDKRLQRTLSVILSVTLFSLLAISVLAVYLSVQPAFDGLEQKVADTNFLRAQRAITSDLQGLQKVTGDWAPWDDTYAFVRGENGRYIDTNIDLNTLNNLGLDLLVIYDREENVVWGGIVSDTGAELRLLDEGFISALPVAVLTAHADSDSKISGSLATPEGAMFVASAPIVQSDLSGPIAGTLLVGTRIDEARIAGYRLSTEVEMDLKAFAELPPQQQSSYRRALASEDSLRSESSGEISEISLLRDLLGEPLMILRVTTRRDISALGSNTLGVVIGSLALVISIVTAILWWSLRKVVVRPLVELTQTMKRVYESGELNQKVSAQRRDEIGQLAGQFDQLLGDLETSRRQLLDQSFKAGRADVAAGILHNIRNALTPLINRASSAQKVVAEISRLNLRRAFQEYTQTSDEQRKDKLGTYLGLGTEQSVELLDEAAQDLEVVARQTQQICDIVDGQASVPRQKPVTEPINLEEAFLEIGDIVDEAGGDVSVHVDPEIGSYSVVANRTNLLQVLGNLVLNSAEAIRRRDHAKSGVIEIGAKRRSTDESALIDISIKDDGCGFEVDDSTVLFERGYSTKTGGSGGLGLHWSANTVAQMGGSISATNLGRDVGAVFQLSLPCAAQ
jgi:sensor domain CHASE-containing protein